jgi:23S rRNA (adenine2503-C2)-methyltransferase
LTYIADAIADHAAPGVMTAIHATVPDAAASVIEKTPLERYVPPAKPSLVGLTRAELAAALAQVGVPEAQRRMRVQQLWHWLYVRGATSFVQMTSVSKELRAALDAHFTLARPEIVAEQISVDGTRKWLLRLPGEVAGERPHEVECVYIPEADRGTLCLSSQVGCTLNCSFCHTGTQRLVRNLTAGEIVGQVMLARDRLKDWTASPNPPLKGEGWIAASDPGKGQNKTPTRTASPSDLPLAGGGGQGRKEAAE